MLDELWYCTLPNTTILLPPHRLGSPLHWRIKSPTRMPSKTCPSSMPTHSPVLALRTYNTLPLMGLVYSIVLSSTWNSNMYDPWTGARSIRKRLGGVLVISKTSFTACMGRNAVSNFCMSCPADCRNCEGSVMGSCFNGFSRTPPSPELPAEDRSSLTLRRRRRMAWQCGAVVWYCMCVCGSCFHAAIVASANVMLLPPTATHRENAIEGNCRNTSLLLAIVDATVMMFMFGQWVNGMNNADVDTDDWV
mmetsp:Transcript_17594/g.48839  ORF Transcript_17594/g.48839 Transcript_17594/m.48839 type:complete len:249 (-) Transcript_17594:228-974(-)